MNNKIILLFKIDSMFNLLHRKAYLCEKINI